MKKNIYILFIILLCGCEEYRSFPIFVLSSNIERICGDFYYDDLMVSPPSQLELKDSCLFLFRTLGVTAKVIKEIDGSDFGMFGNIGQGPDEFISPFYIGGNDSTMYIYDLTLRCVREYNLRNISDSLLFTKVEEKKLPSSDIVYHSAKRLDNGYSVAQILNGTSNLFLVLDEDLKIVSQFGENPFSNKISDMYPFWGYLCSHGNQFVFAAMRYGYIVSYKIRKDGSPVLLWEHYLSQPYYSIHKNILRWNADNLMGFYNVKMNSKYIFALYSGVEDTNSLEQIPNNLLVFDFDGNLVKNFKIDKNCGRLAVSEDNIVYAFYTDPDVGIVKYNLQDYLKN
ncbi:BF3164 family lipoprotein [Parabacteroides bouchesdurhonensis]|uniref:BF3164 family lipoprotein n=1 Tax=Parabacteroides bouchesdurhonensis TaxID=1936995 RepID=UPI000E4CA68E|nr:BF3164 family lipoprotein [Parabacteroides bouchesdurhonensis]RHJ94026.1 hypothetical protein DW095_03280 [Bacteroides sp. AM07-16]